MMPMKEILRLTASDGCKPSSESDQEDVRAQVEGIATLLKASIPPGKDIHGRPSPPSEKPQRCDCGRFPRVHDKGDLCNIGFNEFLGRVQGKLIDMGYEPPLWPEPHIRDCGDVDEALDVCVQWCAARLDEAKAALSARLGSMAIYDPATGKCRGECDCSIGQTCKAYLVYRGRLR